MNKLKETELEINKNIANVCQCRKCLFWTAKYPNKVKINLMYELLHSCQCQSKHWQQIFQFVK